MTDLPEVVDVAGELPSEPKANILLVGTNHADLLPLREILDDLNQNLVEALFGEEAVRRAESQDLAVVLLDVRMSGTAGYETARLLRTSDRSQHTPIIFLAGKDINGPQQEAAYALGAVDFLAHPLLPRILRAKVRGFVQLFRHRQRATQEAEQLRLLVQGTTDYAIFMLDLKGHVVSWNTGAERLKGYKAEEIIGQHFSGFYPQEAIDRGWPAHELKVAQAEGHFEDEGWRVRKDGSTFWANVVITALRDKAGNFRGFSKITRDLTERKQADENARRLIEEATARRVAEDHARLIQEERERLEVTLASIGDAVVSTDAAGQVAFLNPVAEELTGWKQNEALGQPLETVFVILHEQTGRPIEHPVAKVLQEGRVVGLGNHTVLVSRYGVERPIDDSAAPIRDAKGKVVGAVLVFRDVSEQRRGEQHRNARLRVTHRLNGAATVDDGARGVLRAVCESLAWDAGFFWAVNAEATALTCQHGWHTPGTRVDEFERSSFNRDFASGEGLPGRVWATGQPAWILDISRDENFPRLAAATRCNLHSAFGYPVVVENQTLGVLEFFTRRSREPDANLLELMGTVAGSFGQFIERRRAAERLRLQTAIAETLNRIGSLLAAELDLQRLVQIVTDEGTKLCGAQFGAFFYNVLGEQGESYTLYALSGVPHEAFAGFPMPRNTALFGPTFRGESVVRLADVTRDPRYGKTAPHYGMPEGHLPVRSYLAIPVVSRTGEVLGGLFFGHANVGVFSDFHERLLSGIAGQAAVAIDNARLYQRSQTTAERLNVALTAADLGDWSWDAASDLVTLSQRAADIFGIPPGPHMTWTAMQALLHVEDRDHARREVERAIAERVQYGIEYRVHRPDGLQVWVAAMGRAIYDDLGAAQGMFGIVQDITERKRAEEALRHSEERFRSLMEQAPFSIQVFAPDGQTIRVNRAWEELWGVRFEQIEGYNILQDRQLEAKGVLHHIRQAFAGQPARIPAIQYNPNETIPGVAQQGDPRRWLSAVIYPINDAHGRVREVVLIHDDITAQKRAEEELRRSERQSRTILESITDAFCAFDRDWRFTYVNRQAEILLGLTRDDLIGKCHWDVYRDTLGTDLERHYRHAVAESESVAFEYFYPPHNRWYEVHGYPSPDGLSIYFRDVSERKQAEIALAESEQRFRQLADAMPQIVWTARPDGNIDYLNRRWTQFTGLPQTSGNEDWGPLLHPDDAPSASERWAASVSTGEAFEMEIRLLDRGSQEYRWHLIRTVAIKDEAGGVVRWFGTSTDIHGQKRAEESARYLAEASAVLADLIDTESTLQNVANLAVPYFADWAAVDMVDNGSLRRLAVAHQNPTKIRLALELMREYPPDPEATTGAYAVLRSGTPALISEITDDLLVQGAADDRHLRLMRSLGLKSFICVPLIVSGSALGVLTFATAESGRRYCAADLALATDLAHRAAIAIENTQLYQALREADRRKDEFLATLAHELRNPLAPIRNSLELLKLPRVDAETAERSREMMERQVHHLVRLVDDLLDVSRVMRGKIELRKEQVELATVVARAIETVQPLMDAQEHRLSVSLPPESLLLDADPVRLAQVVGNLLTNAAKYTPSNGQIWLSAERSGNFAVLRIRDSGIGMSAEMLPRIFELFVQVDHAAARSHGGLGIGLTLVRNLVEMHNGTVEAHSQGLGKGSEFVVRLPTAAPQTQRDRPGEIHGQRDQPPVSTGYRFLVVDDNQDAANSFSMLLRMRGHDVRVAYSGAAALEMTRTYTPDMVFLDIGMPGMDGYEVARRMRQEPGLKAVVLAALTGWGQQEDRRRTAASGFDHHLVKPPDARALEELLARLKRRPD